MIQSYLGKHSAYVFEYTANWMAQLLSRVPRILSVEWIKEDERVVLQRKTCTVYRMVEVEIH